jgi:hypothetical protein
VYLCAISPCRVYEITTKQDSVMKSVAASYWQELYSVCVCVCTTEHRLVCCDPSNEFSFFCHFVHVVGTFFPG